MVKENNNKYYFSTEDEMTEFYENKSKKVIEKSPTTYVEKSLNDAMKMITEIQEEEKNNISIN